MYLYICEFEVCGCVCVFMAFGRATGLPIHLNVSAVLLVWLTHSKLFEFFFFVSTNMCENGFVCNRVICWCLYVYKVPNMKLNGKMCMSKQCFYMPIVYAHCMRAYCPVGTCFEFIWLCFILCVRYTLGFRFLGIGLKLATYVIQYYLVVRLKY